MGELDDGAPQALPSGGMDPNHRTEPGYIKRQDDYARRLKRVEGQVKGIERMIAQETYCIDILTQVSAVTKALQAVALGLLDEHLEFCVLEAARSSAGDAEAKLHEASEAIGRLVRS
jgi:DNA-binding FrmR family transcriptional regulator